MKQQLMKRNKSKLDLCFRPSRYQAMLKKIGFEPLLDCFAPLQFVSGEGMASDAVTKKLKHY